ncbi:MAG: gamma-glutamyl-gamma-aminobutyrate hydrolase family protein [Clostridiales bacterium]|nr:gamma-glutamyl-gamma-aminobutyrate hydrolase family protein [Clostridiales bacterium]
MVLIGITPSQNAETGRITISQSFLDAVRRTGALPVLLPLYAGDPALWDAMLACVDGLLLSGGGDIDPRLFGEEMHPKSGLPSPLRDEEEFYLCRRAVEMDMPVLGVCRGVQVLNCALGGTIFQDIPSQVPSALPHRRNDDEKGRVHEVDVTPGTLLHQITGLSRFGVNSLHHQSLKGIAPGLWVNAVSTDGIIEGAEMPGKNFVLGTQWHPEILSPDHPEAQAIFDAFIHTADKYLNRGKSAMKIIGLTPATDDKTGRIIINQDYLDAVRRANALPVLLPLYGDDPELWDEMLAHIDGLLITGGADVGPDTYGEEKLPLCGETAPLRDQQEFYLCKKALEMDLPILAICRGHQVLNCALGGTLYQDIEAQFGPELKHPRYEVPKDQVHEIALEKDSLIHQITGLDTIKVNSRHHQAVKTVGRGLKVTAHAPDGLIEGVELPGKKFAVGVQWHPESLSDYAPDAQALFDAFVKACGGNE